MKPIVPIALCLGVALVWSSGYAASLDEKSGVAGAAGSLSGTRPNIIFIFSDDHGAQSIGAYGAKLGVDVTPRIDELASQGVRFDHCFCGNALCGPSRATVLTGKFSHANGYSQNDGQAPFDGNQPTLPKYLHQVGYETAIFGKWHLESKPTGFDAWKVLVGQGVYYNPVFVTPAGKETIKGYVSDVTTDLALNWLSQQHDANKPFLLMIHQKAPHRNWIPGPQEMALWKGTSFPEPGNLYDDYSGRGPGAAHQQMEIGRHMHEESDLQVGTSIANPTRDVAGMPPEDKKVWHQALDDENIAFLEKKPTGKDLVHWKYERYMMNYLRCCKGVDRNVGRVLDYLKEHNLEKNTLVIYSSDQGFFLGEHGWFDKRWIYEESLRMPLIMRWPGHITPGSASEATVQNTDFMPTFLDLAGVKLPTDIHGKSIVPVLEHKQDNLHDAAYYHYYEKKEHNVPKHTGIRTDRYTLAWFYDEAPAYWELFDREKDPAQMKSVYDDPAYAKVREELTAKLKELAAKYGDRTPPWGNEAPASTGGKME